MATATFVFPSVRAAQGFEGSLRSAYHFTADVGWARKGSRVTVTWQKGDLSLRHLDDEAMSFHGYRRGVVKKRRRRARSNPSGMAVASAIGGGVLAMFGAYKSYDNFQTAKDAADKAEAAKIANPEALATWTKTESDSKTAAWTWGGIGLVGAGIVAFSLLSK